MAKKIYNYVLPAEITSKDRASVIKQIKKTYELNRAEITRMYNKFLREHPGSEGAGPENWFYDGVMNMTSNKYGGDSEVKQRKYYKQKKEYKWEDLSVDEAMERVFRGETYTTKETRGRYNLIEKIRTDERLGNMVNSKLVNLGLGDFKPELLIWDNYEGYYVYNGQFYFNITVYDPDTHEMLGEFQLVDL